ncbi:hypothetical protein N7G274_008802 [Stereocaulon virgatum]|uniref:Protein FAF1 n=1 Tax=Stereocaulon virgatum TaxID=373712 RepID=A0ABR4A0A2_9LECA
MAPTLGKRKRRYELADENNSSGESARDQSTNELQTLLRQHFEAAFEPLEEFQPKTHTAEITQADTSDSEAGSDWSGFSEDEKDGVEIIDHSSSHTLKADVSKEELKTFMTNKPPIPGNKPVASTARRNNEDLVDPEEASTDAANLKKDLALQRLLKESHLLDSQSSLSHSGQNRHKALDLRLQDMGSKSSIFTQQKMPLAQRKGIMAKVAEREGTRRRTAKENGIILEKAVRGKKKDEGKRQRGIGAPSVGKFHGGMLKLSKKDVAEIEGPKKASRGRR